MSRCSHCEEDRHSRCSYSDCPFDADQANETSAIYAAEISRLQQQLSDCKAERDFEAHVAKMLLSWAADHGEEPDLLLSEWIHEKHLREAAEAREKQVRAETIEECAKVAERDVDWTRFARKSKLNLKTGQETNVFALPRDPDDTMPTDANVFAYRIGIATGQVIATTMRALGQTEPGEQT